MPNFSDTNIRILWCAAWNQAAQIISGKNIVGFDGTHISEITETLAKELFAGMLKPYEPKPGSPPFNPSTDPATEFADGEWDVPEPRRNDKKVA